MSKEHPTPQERWQKDKRRDFLISFISPTDDEVWDYLHNQRNMAGYIKNLIRADIEKNKN